MGKEDFTWSEDNIACVATYKILEGDKFLDQFEDADVPFADADKKELGKLRYYPKTTANPQIIEILSIEIARKFLQHLTKVYTVKKQSKQVSSGQIVEALAAEFADKSSTIGKLAKIVADNIRFPS